MQMFAVYFDAGHVTYQNLRTYNMGNYPWVGGREVVFVIVLGNALILPYGGSVTISIGMWA